MSGEATSARSSRRAIAVSAAASTGSPTPTARAASSCSTPGAARARSSSAAAACLPAGIVAVRGRFQIGDSVSCVDEHGRELARGLAAYPADAVERIKGCATRDIERVLGYSNGGEVIHRDDLVVLDR